MWSVLLANPLVRKILGSALALVIVVSAWKIHKAEVTHYRNRAEQAEAERDQALSANAQMKVAIDHQNLAIVAYKQEGDAQRARAEQADKQIKLMRLELDNWLDRINKAPVPKDLPGSFAWLEGEYGKAKREFEK